MTAVLLLGACDCGYRSTGAPATDAEVPPADDHGCLRVTAALDGVTETPECHAAQTEVFEALGGLPLQSAVLRLDAVRLAPNEVAILPANYPSDAPDDQLLAEARTFLSLGTDPQLFGPGRRGGHLVAVRRRDDPAGSVVVVPGGLVVARTSPEDGAILAPTSWRDAAILDRGCPSMAPLEGCGFDARSGTELPDAETRLALEAVLGTVLPDAIWRGASVFDAMVVRWSPDGTGPGEWLVVISGGGLE